MPQEWPYLVGLGLACGLLVGIRWILRAPADAAPERAGEDESLEMAVLGGHRLVDVLGRGGMGVVYLAVPDDTLDPAQAVACKVVAREHGDNLEFRDRFLREIAICMRLEHPAIVRLHRGGVQDGRVYLLLELVSGRSLRERVRAGGQDLAPLMPVLEPLLSALTYAHSQGVVHRDLKPENVMIDDDGRIKVMDFGLARFPKFRPITGTGGAVGTPAYMAPEQLRGAEADPRQDQYALGVMLYELLCGAPPFDDRNVAGLIHRKLREAPPALSGRRPDLPRAQEEVIMRMLSLRPEDRFDSVAEAWSALRAAVPAPPSEGTAA